MRGLSRHTLLSALVLVLHASGADAQFSAKGRRRSPAKTAAPAAGSPRAQPPQADTPERTASPSDRREILIDRYRKLLFEQPGQAAVVQRLIELVRERDGHLDGLKRELEDRIDEPGDTGYASGLALSEIDKTEGRLAEAKRHLEVAHEKNPRRPEALVALSAIQADEGNLGAAKRSLEQAAPLTQGVERQAVLRQLRDTSLQLGDLEGARSYHAKLTQDARGNIYLQGELARELLRRGKFEAAVEESQRVVSAAHGDRRALAPALRDLGQAQISAGKFQEAKQSLSQASRLAAADPGLQLQIDTLLAEAHDKAGTLSAHLEELTKSARSSGRQMLLGYLRERRGETELAIAAYRRACELAPRDPDPLLALVRLLELTSNLEEAAKHYRTLTRIAPSQTDLSLKYIELLLAQGRREEALRELDRSARASARDPDATLLLIDVAERIGEKQRALALRQSAQQGQSLEPHHLVELGSRAYRDGDRERAFSLWKRITTARGNPARLQVTYGETLLGHEQVEEGIAALQKALQLSGGDPEVRRALARGYLRAAAQSTGSRKSAYEIASLEQWTTLLDSGNTDSADQARRAEARRQVVRLYERTDQLDSQIARLHRRHHKKPSDLETGRLLALAQIQRSRLAEAEETLTTMSRMAPADREVLRMLDQVQVRQGKLEQSIQTLTRLVEVDPTRAAQTYEELSRRALTLRQDDRALRYAELASERDRGSAEGQARLGDLYARQGKLDRAAEAYRSALSRNDRKSEVALALAKVLSKQGKQEESLELVLRVLRTSRDERELSEAGRAAMTMGLATGQGRRLENELRPLAISMPEQSVYQDLLLEVITAEVTPKMWELKFGTPEEIALAETSLRDLADRCLAPLLSALLKGDSGDQQRAISVLGFGSSQSASTALLEYASSAAPESLRVQATIAATRRHHPALTARLSRLISERDVTYRGKLPRAALLGLAGIDTPEARRGVKLALTSDDPDLRVEAILTLATSPETLSTDELLAILGSHAEGPGPRAAAALALRQRSARASVLDGLSQATVGGDHLVRAAALSALSTLQPEQEQWKTLLSGALFDDDQRLSRAALAALTLEQNDQRAFARRLDSRAVDQLQTPGDQLIWDLLIREPSAAARARALLTYEPALQRSASLGLRTSREGALQVLGALRRSEGATSLLPLLDAASDKDDLPAKLFDQANQASQRIRKGLLPAILSHAGGSDLRLRAAALRTLSMQDGPAARLAILGALSSEEPQVFEAALDALAKSPPELAIEQIGQLLGQEQSWHRVRRIAELLEQVALVEGGRSRKAARALLSRISEESDGLARTRALQALKAIDSRSVGDP